MIGHIMKSGRFGHLAVFVVSVLAGLVPAHAQSGKVVLPLREMTLRGVMGEVQKQTDYKVAVDWDELDPGRRVFSRRTRWMFRK